MIKKILVPTDFSDQALSALKVAAQIAKKNNATIYVVHILEVSNHITDHITANSAGPAPEAVLFMQATHKKFEELFEHDFLQDISIDESVLFDNVTKGIVSAANKNKVDLIIMGSHGSQGFEELFIGSNAEKVVRTANQPVLVVKEDCELYQINDFVYATNFDNEDKPSLSTAQNFAASINAKLHLVWINTANTFRSTHETESKMNLLLSDMSLNNYSLNIYNDISVEKGIFNFANSVNAGMIGISTHGRKGISHFINGSLGEDVVNHAVRPVLTFKI